MSHAEILRRHGAEAPWSRFFMVVTEQIASGTAGHAVSLSVPVTVIYQACLAQRDAPPKHQRIISREDPRIGHHGTESERIFLHTHIHSHTNQSWP